MAPTTRVTHQMLTNAANQTTQTGETIAAGLANLLTEVENMAPSFAGGAGSAFQNASHTLAQELNNLLKTLNGMGENVGVSNKAFADTDAGSAQEIQAAAAAYAPNADHSVVNALTHPNS